jgi:hypothetical protein
MDGTTIAAHLSRRITERLGEDYVFIYTFWIDDYITRDRRHPFWMLFKHEGDRHSTCTSNCDAGTASRCTSTGCRCASSCPHHSRAGIGGESNNYLDELGKWGRRTEEDDDLCRWSGTEPDYDYYYD